MLRTTFPVGPLGCNCSIIADPKTREAIVIDPGDEIPRILTLLAKDNLRCVRIVHTHAHIDHIAGTAHLARVTKAPTYLHDGDFFLHEMMSQQAMFLGIPEPESSPIDHKLNDGDGLSFGGLTLGVMHTPGHTPGSVCFTVGDLCFSGDTLFAGGIGRTDLWGGDYETIEKSIKDRLYHLNGAVEVIPGHGVSTTIDEERRTNPFVRQ